jgi:hypothetical protein
MKFRFIFFILFNVPILIMAQGYNHTWLLSYDYIPNATKSRINFFSNSYVKINESRKIGFNSTQGNISDINGNYLMSSNGVFIANASNDTMLNGSNLNPNTYTSNWSEGLPLSNGNLFLPWPDDSTKYILFHQTGYYDPNYNLASRELFYSIIDISGDSGKGEVVQKNISIIQDSLGYGIGACKHANGRDWWIVALRDSGNTIHKVLLNPTGVQYFGSQNFQFPKYFAFAGQPTFSPDGKKFAYTHGEFNGTNNWTHNLRLIDFDRCTGNFYNSKLIDISDNNIGFGISFSPNSKFLYVSKFDKILQFDTDTSDVAASINIVANYDGFNSPYTWCCATDFWTMYLAANGKIYLSSGSSVNHLHEINFPNNSGVSCDVQQHSIDLNGTWNIRTVPNHPNYYLGCDTTLGCSPCLVTVEEINHDFRFNIYPNPSSGNFNIIYLLPQNKEGKLEVFDITGKVVYEMRLPHWSTLQNISLPSSIANGLYNCVITSDNNRVSRKIAVIK